LRRPRLRRRHPVHERCVDSARGSSGGPGTRGLSQQLAAGVQRLDAQPAGVREVRWLHVARGQQLPQPLAVDAQAALRLAAALDDDLRDPDRKSS
jgi:hypothetical protein